ncbi:MAG: hypothetical protein M3004_14850 [Bacteroidota bacterium]|nr:hypothetical protein [Bacteroidota bacterium]
MKKTIIIGCLSIFIFAKCKKNPPEEQYYGYAKAEINGTMINFNKVKGILLYALEDSIALSFERWDGLILRESISILKIFKGTNAAQRIYKYDYSVNRLARLSSGYYTFRDDGDVGCDTYNIYEPDSSQNKIIITSFNSQTKEIKGTFQATYLIDQTRPKCRLSAPDTIRIRNGEFYTKIF